MSWRKIPMRFPGTCIVCKKRLAVNETGLWAKGVGVKHEACAEPVGIKCIVCGGEAGCPTCELADDCDLERVSPACICNMCLQKGSPLEAYRKAADPILGG